MVEVLPSAVDAAAGMAGSRMPIAVAHGEGRAEFRDAEHLAAAEPRSPALRRDAGDPGTPAERYPANPNGSPGGITGLTSADGRVTILMPHPERVFRSVQHSWHPGSLGRGRPWLRLFRNARVWVSVLMEQQIVELGVAVNHAHAGEPLPQCVLQLMHQGPSRGDECQRLADLVVLRGICGPVECAPSSAASSAARQVGV
jgi:hypothetical protein